MKDFEKVPRAMQQFFSGDGEGSKEKEQLDFCWRRLSKLLVLLYWDPKLRAGLGGLSKKDRGENEKKRGHRARAKEACLLEPG